MINIAIDGPSGAGKSTMARTVSNELGFVYIDTGAMYRTLAYGALEKGIDIKNEPDRIKEMLADTNMEIRLSPVGQKMYLNGADVTDVIRTPEVSMGASDISAIDFVREYLLDVQRDLAKKNDCIMDGRDIGTKILPDADVKIFLTASAEERAKRRYDELIQKGQAVTYSDVLADMIKRDENDSSRACSPLKKADDAIELDTTYLSLEEAAEKIQNIIKEMM